MDVVLEHGESSFARRLRARRAEIAIAAALVEGILLLLGIVPWWFAVVAAIAAVAVYAGFGREHPSSPVRSVTWIAAVSQLTVVLVPVGLVLVGVLVLVVLVAVAIVALTALLLDRR
jgi:hypothetical protein